jgi:hypothetical protein
MTHIVVSAYNKNLGFLRKFDAGLILVYDHGPWMPENAFLREARYRYKRIPNKGCEASAYLRYIIDHYHALPERVVLLHDEEVSPHHEGSLVSLVRQALLKDARYINLNRYTWRNIDSALTFRGFESWYAALVAPYCGDLARFGNFLEGHQGCAQFVVTPECIRRCPRKMYVDLYEFCMRAEEPEGHPPNGFGYFMEYIWHIIFGHVQPSA